MRNSTELLYHIMRLSDVYICEMHDVTPDFYAIIRFKRK